MHPKIEEIEEIQKHIKIIEAFVRMLDKYNNIDLDYINIINKNITKAQYKLLLLKI